MWRRYGDELYSFVVVLGFSVEAVALGVLTWALALRLAEWLADGRVVAFLAGAVAVTAVAALLIGIHVVGYRVLSSRRRGHRRARLEMWTERWVAVLLEDLPPPDALTPEAEAALLELREHLVGTEGERVEWLVRRYGLGEALLRRSRAPSRGGGRLWPAIRRRRLSSRLQALEALAKARLPQAVEPLTTLMTDPEPRVRIVALRSLARTMARLSDGPAREESAERLAEVMARADLPPGSIEEGILLLETSAPAVIRRLLARASPDGRTSHLEGSRLAKVLDAAGRLKAVPLADEVARFAGHPDPEVRAAALRALGSIGLLPGLARQAAVVALIDPLEYVRIQASRTAALLPRSAAREALWKLLGDESWWVRRAAAPAMLHLGTDGPELLDRAGRTHPDRYARHMALQALLDGGHLDAARARRIREVV